MKIVERTVSDVTILDLHGKILIGEGDDALREAVTNLICAGRTRVILNFASVPHVDSAGLGEVVRCSTNVSGTAARLQEAGGKLKLLNLRSNIRDLLATTKLLTTFETYDNEIEAIASFDPPRVAPFYISPAR
jgi:anti-sigma B factor antagonist